MRLIDTGISLQYVEYQRYFGLETKRTYLKHFFRDVLSIFVAQYLRNHPTPQQLEEIRKHKRRL